MPDGPALSLSEAVRLVLSQAKEPLTPQQIRERIKVAYPHLYMTESHRKGVESGNYNNFDHALLAPIYNLVTHGSDFSLDRSQKPMRVSLVSGDIAEESFEENYESESGIVYILDTSTFTLNGRRIVKIGHTTQPLETRIAQLYTTGTPFQFKEIRSWRVRSYIELEQAIHKLVAPFRINRAREFFSEDAVPFAISIVNLHESIQAAILPSAKIEAL